MNAQPNIIEAIAEPKDADPRQPAPAVHLPAPAPTAALTTPMEMLGAAISQGAGVEVLEKLMGLQERHERNLARRAFDAAMAAAAAEMPTISKNRTVDFTSAKGRTNYRHEDLGEIVSTVDPILAAHGLFKRFRILSEGNTVTVTCIVSHRDGWSEENTLSAGRDQSGNKNDIQAIGSAVTYLQRYTLKASLGLAASNDDDGQSTGNGNGHGEKITPEQVSWLNTLADEVGADKQKFAQYMKAKDIPDIAASQFDRAVAALNAKRAKA